VGREIFVRIQMQLQTVLLLSTDAKMVVLKEIVKFTLKMLRHAR